MSKIKWIYVTTKNKQPIHLVDPYYNMSDVDGLDVEYAQKKLRVDPSKERFPIDIDAVMIEKGIPAKVPSDPFVQGMIKNETLVEVDAPVTRKQREPKKQEA